MAGVAAVAQVRSLGQEILQAMGAVKKEEKKIGLSGRHEKESPEFPMWHNGISGVSGALGHRFDPRPDTVG